MEEKTKISIELTDEQQEMINIFCVSFPQIVHSLQYEPIAELAGKELETIKEKHIITYLESNKELGAIINFNYILNNLDEFIEYTKTLKDKLVEWEQIMMDKFRSKIITPAKNKIITPEMRGASPIIITGK